MCTGEYLATALNRTESRCSFTDCISNETLKIQNNALLIVFFLCLSNLHQGLCLLTGLGKQPILSTLNHAKLPCQVLTHSSNWSVYLAFQISTLQFFLHPLPIPTVCRLPGNLNTHSLHRYHCYDAVISPTHKKEPNAACGRPIRAPLVAGLLAILWRRLGQTTGAVLQVMGHAMNVREAHG